MLDGFGKQHADLGVRLMGQARLLLAKFALLPTEFSLLPAELPLLAAELPLLPAEFVGKPGRCFRLLAP